MDDQTPPAPPPAPPVSAPPVSSWNAPPPAAVPGAPGYVYADVPNRFIALLIDAFIVFVLYVLLAIVLGIVGLSAGAYGVGSARFDAIASIVFGLLLLAVYAAYFLWSWTRARATIGMRLLGLQVGNAFDGKTLTMEQAIRRGVALWGPWFLSSIFGNLAGVGPLLGLASFVWALYLLYSTASSPTKQGFHDKFANTVVVKAGRVV